MFERIKRFFNRKKHQIQRNVPHRYKVTVYFKGKQYSKKYVSNLKKHVSRAYAYANRKARSEGRKWTGIHFYKITRKKKNRRSPF